MLILDTSLWIEVFNLNPAYYPRVLPLIEQREIFAIECVFGELLQGARNKAEQGQILQYRACLPKINNKEIFIEAGLYVNKHKLYARGVGLIEAVILMHGLHAKAKIWTLDKKFKKIIPKELVY
ncbi:MAG: PIN domain-containing protein [Candidatus Margulisbacteria bacterium]|jgi:predicted nucleic acid-binding protein|nr:PIN domain-containing protein [Candidatus Margulisiibacteriota bacterium]